MLRCFIETTSRQSLTAAKVVAAILVCASVSAGAVQAARQLSSQEAARHIGLKRAWFAQVRLDQARNRVERAVLKGDRLTVLTTAGVMQEFNALTGDTLWIAPIGNPNYPSLGPAVSDQHIALLNGSTLYVLDRADGRPVIVRRVGGAPGAAPALAEKHVFVPLVNGRIEGYSLGEQKLTPWYYQSSGRAMVAPLATPVSVVWATDSGNLYVAKTDILGVRFRLESRSEIIAQPAYRKPFVYVAAVSGELFAMHEMTGARRWKYATGFPIARAPAVVGERVFLTTGEPALHCVDATRGNSLWEARGIAQFAAAGGRRVYGVDEFGALVALDAATGARLGQMTGDSETNALVNDQTDRIYLLSADGVLQCLHELEVKEPLYHDPAPKDDEQPSETAEDQPAEPAVPDDDAQPETSDETSPFGAEDDEADETEDAEMPAEDGDSGAEDDNPFEAL